MPNVLTLLFGIVYILRTSVKLLRAHPFQSPVQVNLTHSCFYESSMSDPVSTVLQSL